MPTLRDIAKRANVSISTVSKALNNSHEISGHTAARVVKAARELHYISLEDDTGGISQAARTIGAVRAIREAGLEVPGDLSIASHDDIHIARYLETPLTTVGIPYEKLAQLSAESLLHRLRTGDLSSATHSTLKPDLYVRESTGPAKK